MAAVGQIPVVQDLAELLAYYKYNNEKDSSSLEESYPTMPSLTMPYQATTD